MEKFLRSCSTTLTSLTIDCSDRELSDFDFIFGIASLISQLNYFALCGRIDRKDRTRSEVPFSKKYSTLFEVRRKEITEKTSKSQLRELTFSSSSRNAGGDFSMRVLVLSQQPS